MHGQQNIKKTRVCHTKKCNVTGKILGNGSSIKCGTGGGCFKELGSVPWKVVSSY